MPASPTRICTVIGRTRHRMVLVEMQEAVKRGADLIELRLDFIAKAPDFKRLLAEKRCELVATVRRPADGGRWSGSEDARRMLLRQCIVSGGFEWVDLETDVAHEIRRYKSVKRIVSYHNTKEIPDNLEDIYGRMCAQDPDVVKVTVPAATLSDNRRLLDLVRSGKTPTVAFCSGDLGVPSRLLNPALGAPFVYAAFNKERGIAPGMPSFQDVRSVYHAERVNPQTQVYAVVGDPVAHSFSPLVHNAAFAAAGINAVYVPVHVPKGHLAECLKTFEGIIRGYSVTIPHKEAAAHEAALRDRTVDETHAANTLVRIANGFHAYNTDFQAFLDTLYAGLPADQWSEHPELHRVGVLILGAGGMARTVAHALAKAGCTIRVAGRSHDRAERLAGEVGGESLDWKARHKEGCRIVVNCTPVGMHPNVDESPLHNSYLRPGLVVFETVYTPETTLLVKEARARGATVITGVDLFTRQAATQFRLFTGQDPPAEVMAQAMRRALSPVSVADGG